MEGGGFANIGRLLNAYYPNFDAPVESEATKQAQICRAVSSAPKGQQNLAQGFNPGLAVSQDAP
jgi:hypothetical protein